MTGWFLTVLVPSALWALGHVLAGRGERALPFPAYPAAGFFAPAGLARWCGRPFPEQVAGWVVSLISWAGVFVIRDAQLFVAFGILGAAWGAALGAKALRASPPTPVPSPPEGPVPERPAPRAVAEAPSPGFALELRCPACGAALAVPVYHRMTRCEFCGSEHVVSFKGDPLAVVIPDALAEEPAVKDAILKHLRHRRYLTLYDRRVRPLVPETAFVGEDGDRGIMLSPPDGSSAIADAVEAEVMRAADAYAAGIGPRIRLLAHRRFLSPYWHRFGTLYQAAFGRDAEGLKRMELAVVTVEASVAACREPLPPMGKLSYLRTLRPLQGAPEAAVPALPPVVGADEIDKHVQQVDRRTSELALTPIAVHATLVPEVVALVYRPWHLASAELDGERLDLLLDGGAGTVEGERFALGSEPAPIPEAGGEAPALAPSRCPECGAALPFEPDAVAHLCGSCFRLVAMSGNRWSTLPYVREDPQRGRWLLPFWRFPLRLRATSGELVTDFAHLTDGIDGTYDRVGGRPQVEQKFFVPAFRTRVGKSGVRLYRLLWPLLHETQRPLAGERFTPARPPEHAVEVTLGASEARAFARVYLALAFHQRDLARAQARTVRERFLSASLEGTPQLAYLNVPEEVVAPFAAIFGRARPIAVADLEGRAPAERTVIRV